MVTLRELLQEMNQKGASDLHITAGVPPEFRVDGLITPSQHDQFTDAYWFAEPGDISGGREISRTINDWALWFLNKHLKGLDEPMPALKDYPRITGRLQTEVIPSSRKPAPARQGRR